MEKSRTEIDGGQRRFLKIQKNDRKNLENTKDSRSLWKYFILCTVMEKTLQRLVGVIVEQRRFLEI